MVCSVKPLHGHLAGILSNVLTKVLTFSRVAKTKHFTKLIQWNNLSTIGNFYGFGFLTGVTLYIDDIKFTKQITQDHINETV